MGNHNVLPELAQLDSGFKIKFSHIFSYLWAREKEARD